MGYTHYYKKPGGYILNAATFSNVVELAHKIISACEKDSPIGGVYYDGEVVEIVGPNGDKSPITSGDMLQFNGKGDNAHEALIISNRKEDLELGSFNFCKTARKPYDIVVTAVLIAFKAYFLAAVTINSDGYIEDWEPGLELYNICAPENKKVGIDTLKKWISE